MTKQPIKEGMFHVIDDEKELCELSVELLNSAGYGATSFSNPVEYLNYLYGDCYVAPTAIITDVRMPEMSGYVLIDKIREKFPRQKIVVVSGYDGETEVFRKKVCHFLSKPFLPEKFIAIADAIVRCDKEDASGARSICEGVPEESSLNSWVCPLDCLACEKKEQQP